MDPQQTAALNALAPYLALSATANSPAAATTCISQAISSPNTYVFAELLSKPQIQALRGAEAQHATWLKVLEIFSWGTWTDYRSISGLPQLSTAQANKLRLLTLITLAQGPSQNLTYPSLLSALELEDVAVLQALLTQAIYEGLLTAKLNPRMQRVDLISVTPLRDLAPGSVNQIMKILAGWENQCALVHQEIERKISGVIEAAEKRQEREDARKQEVEDALTRVERPTKREGDILGEIRPNDGKRGGHHGFLAGKTMFG